MACFGFRVFLLRAASAVAVVCLAAPVLAATGAGAQAEAAPQPPREAVAARDQLIANQENLLNAYRCIFNADIDAVPGGCPNPATVSPGPVPENPTPKDIAVRDGLIQDQEALLNAYRCQFDIDTQLGPGGCASGPDGDDANTSVGPEPEPQEVHTEAAVSAAEAEIADLVNNLRKSLGLDALAYYPEVAAVARRWSQTMAAEGNLVHNPRFSEQYPDGSESGGENISWQSRFTTLSEAVQSAFDGLVASPGHYANMTNPQFTHLGVGIAVDQGGGFWVTQNFARYPGGTRDPVILDAPEGEFTAIAAGNEHSCALGADGAVACWGDFQGSLAAPAGVYTAIAADDHYSCALGTGGAVTCWTWRL